MRARACLLTILVSFPLACGGTHVPPDNPDGTVARVLDGDTVVLTDGRHVRLVQLDAPEIDESECYAQQAKRTLERFLPVGVHVRVETDPALDKVDRFGRTLAYVERNGADINLELVKEGAAAPWFYHGDRGRHAALLLTLARRAEHLHRGLWGACPATVLDPLHSVEAER
ncbi:MAG TPA: thermonuclease family protein [Gaiellaceae bacterium]|nr:thermonuclease family protein [Gaiellaceae bacterium]